jgi:hypothetical protein
MFDIQKLIRDDLFLTFVCVAAWSTVFVIAMVVLEVCQ